MVIQPFTASLSILVNTTGDGGGGRGGGGTDGKMFDKWSVVTFTVTPANIWVIIIVTVNTVIRLHHLHLVNGGWQALQTNPSYVLDIVVRHSQVLLMI